MGTKNLSQRLVLKIIAIGASSADLGCAAVSTDIDGHRAMNERQTI